MPKKKRVADLEKYTQTSISRFFKSVTKSQTVHSSQSWSELNNKQQVCNGKQNNNDAVTVTINTMSSTMLEYSKRDTSGNILLPFELPHYSDSEDITSSADDFEPPKKREKLLRLELKEVCDKKSRRKLFPPDELKQSECTGTQSVIPNKGNKENCNANKRPKISVGIYPAKENKKCAPLAEDSCKQNESVTSLNDTIIVDPQEFISTSFLNETEDNVVPVSQHSKATIISNILISKKSNSTLENSKLTPIKKDSKLNTEPGCSFNTSSPSSPNLTVKLSTSIKKELNNPRVEDEEDTWSPLALQFVLKIVKFIIRHNSLQKLLKGSEIHMLNKFLQLPKPEYMFLCIKLYTRKKKWYEIFNLRTTIKLEISDPEVMEMYRCLSEMEFVDVDYSSEPIHSLLEHLLKKDLKELCAEFKLLQPKFTKPEMIRKLLSNCDRQSTLTFQMNSTRDVLLKGIKKKMGYCVKLSSYFNDILDKIHLLYSFITNEFETPNDLYFFLSKIEAGTITMPAFSINSNIEIFRSIDEFSSFKDANDCRKSVIEAIATKNNNNLYQLCQIAAERLKLVLESYTPDDRPLCLERFTAGYNYTKALWFGCKPLTTQYPNEVHDWLLFLLEQQQFCQYLRGLWYSALINIQIRYLKKYNMAINSLIGALQDKNLTKVDLVELNKRAENIKHCKTYKVSQLQFGEISSVQPIPMDKFPSIEIDEKAFRSESPGKKRNYYKKSENGLNVYTVEQIALEHYLKNGFANGLHCEGALLVTTFFVLLWDIIYGSQVPYAFISDIQHFPLDLMFKEFYINRQKEIDSRLLQIESFWSLKQLETHICHIWENNAQKKSFINLQTVDQPQQLYQIVLCIGRIKICKILQHFLEDFKTYRSGLPDLFLWNVKQKKCKFVEVKGENDRLSAKQECWLDFLRSINADIEVCHVHTMGSKRRHPKIKTEKKKKKSD